MKKIYVILGSITLVLGTLGFFLPLLPTTPFYLLTAWLYMRGSEKLYFKVMNNKYFGTVVRSYQEDKSISLRTKIIVVSTLWGTILLSAFLAVSAWWIRLLLFAVATGVTIHVLSFRTKGLILFLRCYEKYPAIRLPFFYSIHSSYFCTKFKYKSD